MSSWLNGTHSAMMEFDDTKGYLGLIWASRKDAANATSLRGVNDALGRQENVGYA